MKTSIIIKIGIAAITVAAVMVPHASAQALTPDLTTRNLLLKKEEGLKKAAAVAGGAAGIKLSDYPNHYTMVAYRSKSGTGELHEKYADFFYVIRGNAMLRAGGKLVNSTSSVPGELHGSSVEGGTERPLHEGDIVHIPAGVPHQLVVPVGKEFYYFVIKVREQ